MTQVPAGVYRGAPADIAPIAAYERFLGRQVTYVVAFMADTPASWAQFEAGTLAASTNGGPGPHTAADWAPILGGRKLALAVPACCMGSTWADEAAGKNDQHWAALARTLITAGLGNSTLRIAREFNGSWYRWTVNGGNAAAYRTAYARIVTVMRGVPGAAFRFCWNPCLGQGTFGPGSGAETAWPGAGVVDEIGLDVYDGDWAGIYPGHADQITTTQQQQVWDGMLTEWDSLRGWYNVARGAVPAMPVPAGGIPLSFPEWGLRTWMDGGTYHGGGDNAILIRGMAEFITGCGAAWHALWEDPLRGVADPDTAPGRLCAVPMARAAFLGMFGA